MLLVLQLLICPLEQQYNLSYLIRVLRQIILRIQGIYYHHRLFLNARQTEERPIDIDPCGHLVEGWVEGKELVQDPWGGAQGAQVIKKGHDHDEDGVGRETTEVGLVELVETQELLHQDCDFFEVLEMGEVVLHEGTGLEAEVNFGLVHLGPVLVDLWVARVVKDDVDVEDPHELADGVGR